MTRRELLALMACGMLSGTRTALAQERGSSNGPRVPAVELLDHAGQAHALHTLIGGPTLVSFFFTGCSTICPPQTAVLRELQQRLAAARPKAGVRAPLLLSISLDPLNDTPAVLDRYAKRFRARLGRDAGWLMLTGTLPALRQVWIAFDAPVGQPAEHTSLLWVSDASARRWTRTSALTPTARLADMLTQGAS